MTDLSKHEWEPVGTEFVEKYWTTRDKKRILVRDLGDRHLTNILKWLKRYADRKVSATVSFYLHCPEPQGDMAQLSFDSEFDYWACDQRGEDGVHELEKIFNFCADHPAWETLATEAEKRMVETADDEETSIFKLVFGVDSLNSEEVYPWLT